MAGFQSGQLRGSARDAGLGENLAGRVIHPCLLSILGCHLSMSQRVPATRQPNCESGVDADENELVQKMTGLVCDRRIMCAS